MAASAHRAPERERQGIFRVGLVVLNHVDEVLARGGRFPASKVRRAQFAHVLVDPRATTLCLPQDIVDALGLSMVRKVSVRTPDGVIETAIHEGARIRLAGRMGTFDCIAMPPKTTPVVGGLPLRSLGLQPDFDHRMLIVLPGPHFLVPSPLIID